MNPDICMIVHNDVIHDSRVLKEASSLSAAGWQVLVVGASLGKKTPPEHEVHPNGFTIIRVTPPFFQNAENNRFGQLLRLGPIFPALSLQLRRAQARVYHAHDFTGLFQVAVSGLWRQPVVYDSHELFFDRPLPDMPAPIEWAIKTMRPLEGPLARRAMGVITVNEHIAHRLHEKLRLDTLPVIVRNAADLRLPGSEAVKFPFEDRRIVVHSGYLLGGRHLPELVESVAHLPADVALVLMGRGALHHELETLASQLGISDRVRIVPPVPPDNVAATIAQADAAAVLMTDVGLNNQYSLPNKFFEAVAAGLPLVTGSNVEIAALLRRHELGVVCNPHDPVSIAEAITRVLEPDANQIFRQNALRARETLNWAKEEEKLVAFYQAVFSRL